MTRQDRCKHSSAHSAMQRAPKEIVRIFMQYFENSRDVAEYRSVAASGLVANEARDHIGADRRPARIELCRAGV